ncbi:MAG: UDP-N-acetylmuramate:L-alanyl-gamma-D-glutamyl-meso-diaminopimelate ligase [Betaproteobacteria bacterium RIFCSPLOWO2_12_FULL_63_13]|nr:MAG: UDP-N-acetylmuramate:L-alanyl-gamma-D-glutamyl-meso-diaminopimelate ligase [Betaproteobacteria bacterium RIFCSPLOWO2_12_FULL_63_13]
MHIHILGVCGTFMGGLALIAKQAGHHVTGCDADVYPPMSTQLAGSGIELIAGYGDEQLALRPDLWVIGNVVSRGNTLMEAILERGDRYVSGPQWLSENVLLHKWVLAVAGTHGKTSTSAMLAWILEDAGHRPGFLIGGLPRNFDISARLTDGDFFVIEADEYDTAFFDKRPKFLHYRPKTAILNNIEFDHADIFADLASIERQFHYFVRTIPRSGLVVSNGREPAIDRVLAQGCWTPVERFGVDGGWQTSGERDECFEVSFLGRPLGEVRWDLLGAHNRLNALAAIAGARHAGVPPGRAIAALDRFQNVRRRLEIRGTVGGIFVYDDFAHHPTAIATTLAGLRRKVGGQRILAVFEPRSNTMKLGVLKDQLPASLAAADRVYCYSQRLEWNPRETLAPLGAKLRCEAELEALVAAVASDARSGDHVVIMSNGDFGGIHAKLLDRLGSRDRSC